MHPTTQRILNEMQNLEEIGGPEGEEYVAALETIIRLAQERKATYRAIQADRQGFDDQHMLRVLTRVADQLEQNNPDLSVPCRQVAEYMENRLIPIERRRP